MKHLIDKSALVAEIERRKKEWSYGGSTEAKYKVEAYNELIEWLDTLEVKEVDLEKEYEEFVVDDPIFGKFITNDIVGMEVAKHFFELGIKAQKGKEV